MLDRERTRVQSWPVGRAGKDKVGKRPRKDFRRRSAGASQQVGTVAGRFVVSFAALAPCALLQSRIERPPAGFRRILVITHGDRMGVSYAYDLASTLYNDAEQRPMMVKKGLTRAGIEKV